MRSALVMLLAIGASCLRGQDAAASALEKAYAAVQARQWDAAVEQFEIAVARQPRPAVWKDLAYACLKTGERERARDAFAEALRLEPGDRQSALEFAFLAYETGQPAAARRTFDRLRQLGDATAAAAFENIDRPLREGIERWRKAVELAPDRFTNHEELARLAEQRDELSLAAEHYREAWRLRPDLRYLLLDLGRVWKEQGKAAESMSALLAVSRGAEPRTAERARELLPSRYPYVYEWQAAIALDPDNVELRRELAYLLLEMGRKSEAEEQFSAIVASTNSDLLSTAQLGFLKLARGDRAGAQPLLERVLESKDAELCDRVRSALGLPRTLVRRPETPRARVSDEARVLAEKSLEKGYLKDALKYLKIAHENDPVDFGLLLKLGWTSNLLHQDGDAVRWFGLASRSPDAKTAQEAAKAERNLARGLAHFRTSAWALPFYSSRWKNLFSYGQTKVEWLGGGPVRPYVSLRFIGDVRGRADTGGAFGPQYMSESSFIAGMGVATKTWKGVMAWAEAGRSMRYLAREEPAPSSADYRGGAAWARGWGHSIASESAGLVFEANADAVFVSRFGNDTLVYAQTRTGYTLPKDWPVRVQLLWNANMTLDTKGQAWANFTEHGPGVRFRVMGMPPGLVFSVNALYGRYAQAEANPYGPKFHDIRAGFWYAWSR